MSEIDKSGRAFEALGKIVDAVGGRVVQDLVEMAHEEWSLGRPGPMVQSPEGADPAYSLTVSRDGVGFRIGAESGILPEAALVALANVAARPTAV